MSSETAVTSSSPWKTRATRVLPSYRDLISDYLGMGQVILGFVTLIFSIVGFIVKSFTSAASSAMLTAVFVSRIITHKMYSSKLSLMSVA